MVQYNVIRYNVIDHNVIRHVVMQYIVTRRNILNGNEITHNFRQNRRMIAIYESLGAFCTWKAYALHSACKMDENVFTTFCM